MKRWNHKDKLDATAHGDVANGPEDLTDWNAIAWRDQEAQAQRLRQRIFKATQANCLPAHAGCLSRVPRRVACTVLRGPRRRNAPRLPD
jgi:hypothetical protein